MSEITRGAADVEATGTVVASERLNVEEPNAHDCCNSSRCEDDDIAEPRRCSGWRGNDSETTISAGGGTTENASEDAEKSNRETAVKRNMLLGRREGKIACVLNARVMLWWYVLAGTSNGEPRQSAERAQKMSAQQDGESDAEPVRWFLLRQSSVTRFYDVSHEYFKCDRNSFTSGSSALLFTVIMLRRRMKPRRCGVDEADCNPSGEPSGCQSK